MSDWQKQQYQLVQQRTAVAVGEHQSLVDAGDQGNGGYISGGATNQQGNGLQRMPHDVLGFGIAAGLLVQRLDARHLFSFLGCLDAICNEHQTPIGFKRLK